NNKINKIPALPKIDRIDSSESDSEPEGGPARPTGVEPAPGSFARTQVIHSGHFMVSSPHSDSAARRRKSGGSLRYDFDTVNRTWCQTYRYHSGSLSIDPTLTRLFECMSLAYSGKIVSPKWKSFKGLRLLWRDKIRLNNAIWRAWFIQYVEKRKNPVCGFVTPLEGSEAEAHRKPEAIILEGSYWKRRIEVVIKEYHKWRIYYKKRVSGQTCQAKLDRWSSHSYQQPEVAPVEAHMFDLDCLLSDISDTLFTMTQKPCPWTSDRHNTYTSNADMIQPGLTPLQPSMDDFMDIPDIFLNYRGQPTHQSGFADCSYFDGPPSTAYAPVPSPVVTAPQLLIDTQLSQVVLLVTALCGDPPPLQPTLSSDSLAQPSTSSPRSEQTRASQDCGEYHTSSMASGAMSYGHQSYHDASASTAYTSNAEQPVSASVPFLHPLPCHKFGLYTTTSVTSTVITHTASTMGAQGSVYQAHTYSPAVDPYSQTHCHSLSYPAAASDPVHAALAPVTATHCLSVPEQLVVSGVRGKHKQKTGGLRTAGSPDLPSNPQSTAPIPTSCLAKLLSSSTHDSELIQTTASRLITAYSETSRAAPVGGVSSTLQHGAGWPTVMTPPLGHSAPRASTSRGSAVSALLTHGSTNSAAALLVPKTEKLSPVPLYATDRSSLTGTRITHISAEQKRRFNIKLGFDTLHNLVTTLSSQPSIKISKATTLQKTAEYISKMQQERAQLHEEVQRLREEIQHLNSAINACQQQLPATGVPITRQRFDYMRQKFREYVRAQTLQNWKFWIFSIIIEPLFESYNGMVSTASVEDLCRSTLSWLDQHCALPALRPMVLSSLRLLSTTTAILTDPSLLPEQAALAVTQGEELVHSYNKLSNTM
uniref:MLX interacting protein like n=1 Tax=Poecilia latipinna TaxID=48699 RepID=A0A3B3V0F5_9TELE